MIFVPISLGDLVDKITILNIKLEQITDPDKIKNIQKEYGLLTDLSDYKDIKQDLESYYNELLAVNFEIWQLEDKIREHEVSQIFDHAFVSSSRRIHLANKKRSQIKKEINIKFKSEVIEEKSYKDHT